MLTKQERRRKKGLAYLAKQPKWIRDALNGDLPGYPDHLCFECQLSRMFRFPPGHYRRLLAAERAVTGGRCALTGKGIS